MNPHRLRVLIAEDNEDLRELLVTLVSAEPDLKCVGTAEDVEAVIACTAEGKADVLVLDLELQGRSSIDVLKTVRSAGSKMTIVVFSGHAHPDMIRHTLAAGRGRLRGQDRRLRAAARRHPRQDHDGAGPANRQNFGVQIERDAPRRCAPRSSRRHSKPASFAGLPAWHRLS